MKTVKNCVASLMLFSLALLVPAYGMPLNSSARTVVPSDLQQLISVDYRSLKDSSTAMQLKDQVLPDNIKQFESALKGIGINPDKDVDTLTFAAFRTAKQGVKGIVVAAGPFNMKAILKKITLAKIKPTKYRTASIYSMDGGFVMTFLDDSTLLFGEPSAVRLGLDARDGEILNLDSNQNMSDMMTSVDSAPVWSILDQSGTQNMMRSALGDAAKIADYETIKKRLLGSNYTLDFSSGVSFEATVVTSDSTSAALLSSLAKGGVLLKKMGSSPIEKKAMEDVVIDSDSSSVKIRFKSNDQQFQSFMHSDLFAAVTR